MVSSSCWILFVGCLGFEEGGGRKEDIPGFFWDLFLSCDWWFSYEAFFR
jgi:hypothetical protein